MCAIAGLLVRTGQCTRHIRRMTELMRHRGPNNAGFLFQGPAGIRCVSSTREKVPEVSEATATGQTGDWLALGHRRLSIVDLSILGDQPMHAGGRYWIVYNGEVYNHLELRSELEQDGHRFQSHSDTEVILAAYAKWGTEAFSRLNGMWALAIYDAQTNELVLSRDRFGVKPLYYWQTPDLLAFASEIKAFTCLPGWRAKVNGQAVHDFLLSGLQDHSEETMFAEVRQLAPGQFARLNCSDWLKDPYRGTGRLETVRWYQLQPRSFSGSFEEAAARFRELLMDSVLLRLRADVPVGSCLSGGLDSSSIVCATHQLLKVLADRPVHKTFSACSEHKRFDEREYIEQVKQSTRVEAHYVFPSAKDLFEELEKVIWHQDEPFAGTSIFAQWCVFKLAAREQVRVMLDGQGADEQLCGYNEFRRAFFCGLIRSWQPLLAWQEALLARGTSSRALVTLVRAVSDAAMPGAAQRLFRRMRRQRRQPAWFRASSLGASYPGRLACRFGRGRSAREMSLEQLAGAHLQMLLHWEDRNAMAHSVEARMPFLDYRLVEFVTGLPDHYKIREGMTKAVLRRGMEGKVPAAVLKRRDKLGFVTPEEIWARDSYGSFRSHLLDGIADCRGIVNPDALLGFEETLAGKRPYDSAIWRIICLGKWMRVFNVTP